ncbi:hypothetical protein [Microlunatus sagamiharensis]|uniref:hypothetical protein n=1 Tax=Microlunatus sagamiharensis TaxID=546874 RepID=UPI0012FDFA47|nr:hypothetical protein [Microlunatus sagamiharensis]
MDRLTRLRAPLAVVALAALTLVALARVVLGLSEVGAGGSTAVAAARLAPNGSDGALTVLVGVLVAACAVGPEVPVRRRLAVWGAVLTAVSLVATVLALSLTSVAVAGWSLVWTIPDVVVPVVVGLGLVALARPAPEAPPAAGEPAALEQEPEQEPEPDPELQPSWTPDAAAGAVWRTAGEAASGAPASGWGSQEASPWASPERWSTTGPVEDGRANGPVDDARPDPADR